MNRISSERHRWYWWSRHRDLRQETGAVDVFTERSISARSEWNIRLAVYRSARRFYQPRAVDSSPSDTCHQLHQQVCRRYLAVCDCFDCCHKNTVRPSVCLKVCNKSVGSSPVKLAFMFDRDTTISMSEMTLLGTSARAQNEVFPLWNRAVFKVQLHGYCFANIWNVHSFGKNQSSALIHLLRAVVAAVL